MTTIIDLVQTHATDYANVNLELRSVSGATTGQNFDFFEHQGGEWKSTSDNSLNKNGDIWSDVGSGHPGHFYVSSNISTSTYPASSLAGTGSVTVTSTNKYIHIWKNTASSSTYMGYFDAWTPFQSSGWTTSSTHTAATGTQSHTYVQDSIRDITFSKTAAYQFEWEFKFRDVSSAPYNQAMGQNAVTMTTKHWPGGGTTSTDIVQYTFNQVDSTNVMTVTSATQYPNAQIDTGDVVTLHADINMQVLGTNGSWGWITAGDIIATATYEATNVVVTVGSGYVGDTVSVEFVDTNQYPDYDNDVYMTYGASGSTSNLTSSVLGSTTKLQGTNNHTLSGTWTVGYDGVSNTGLAGSLESYRMTPAPANVTHLVSTHQFGLNPYGQSGNSRRRAHSFW